MHIRLFLSALAVASVGFLSPSASFASPFTFPIAGATPTSVAVTSVDDNVASNSTGGTGTTTASSSSTGTFGPTFPASATASINLLTGDLKVDGSGSFGFSAGTRGWDFLTFDDSGIVDFAFSVDGTLQNAITGGMVAVEAYTWLIDVSSWTSYSGTDFDGFPIVALNGTGSPTFPTDYRVAGSTYDSRAVQGTSSTGCTTNFITNCVTNSTGTVLDGDLALSGSWAVDPSKLYLLYLGLNVYTFNTSGLTGNTQAADFAHTGTFAFTNLNGLTFQSASGEFLSEAAPQPVPEPASLLLIGTGMCGSWLAARRRARRAGRAGAAA